MPRTGRPRSFDRAAAVDKAVLLFWENGYEATSLAQLKEGLGGLSAPSFYAAFGSKEALFGEVLARYLETYGQVTAGLHDRSLGPRTAVEQTLRESARMQTDRTHPPGCLVVLSGTTCAAEHRPLREAIAAERARTRAGFAACVTRAVAAGELPANTPAEALATAFDTFLQGMSARAREGTSRTELGDAVTQIMRVWDSQNP